LIPDGTKTARLKWGTPHPRKIRRMGKMTRENYQPNWHIDIIKPRLLWSRKVVRPAEVGYALAGVMMNRDRHLEDANYNKIVPNDYIVEVSIENYQRSFEPISDRLVSQWREKLVHSLMTANSRLGRKEYRFGGQLRIDLRQAPDLGEAQVRLLSRVSQDIDAPVEVSFADLAPGPGIEVGYLEMVNGPGRWNIFQGDNVIGRDESCDIRLDLPVIQEMRLVSSQHAYIRCVGEQCLLYDGSPAGRSSANGTFLNGRRISKEGVPLEDGDRIALAAADPARPDEHTTGTAAFHFRTANPGGRK
jgi:hypothetical protein